MSGAKSMSHKETRYSMGKFPRRILTCLALTTCMLAALPAAASQADFEVLPGSFTSETLTEAGQPDVQAGGHPWAIVNNFDLSRHVGPDGYERPDEYVKDVIVDIPQGFVGNPAAMPRCDWSELNETTLCPLETQIGKIALDFDPVSPPHNVWTLPVYNMRPSKGHTAEFGFKALITQIRLVASVRPGDHGIRVKALDIPQSTALFGQKLTLWGVPGHPSHDLDRGRTCGSWGCDNGNVPSRSPRVPFLTNPTGCTGPQTTTMRYRSWEQPDVWKTVTTTAPPTTGCERLRFEPGISAEPTDRRPDAPTGLTFDLSVPQGSEDPDGVATSAMRAAKVTLPEGMTVNAGSADGLGACSDDELGYMSEEPDRCPDASKIGSVTVDTPLLEKPLDGSVYLGRQTPSQLLRLFLVLDGQGIRVKLRGKVDLDPQTGRLTASFENTPQLPFSNMRLAFKGGPRAALATPPTCGEKTVVAELTPWSGQATETVTDTFTIDCPGMGGFSPSFAAGAVIPTAGRFSPFGVRIARQDREQILDGVSLEMPKGVLARLRGVPLCSDADATAGTCGEQSRVGRAVIGAGAGSNPYYLTAPVSLAGPYKGAPYSLSVAVRVIAGPLDLGTVVVRQALHVDPDDAHVTVVSDPLPTIVEGVPVRLRSVDVDVDRPGFTVNPTSCAEKRVQATFHSQQGSTTQAATRFQVGDCQALPFSPKLAMRLSGKSQTRTGGHPGLTAVLTQGSGQAGIGGAKVTLPRAVVLDPTNTSDPKLLCGYDESLSADCPASSVIGRATAVTPLLNRPLTGDVHLVQGIKFGPKGNRIRTTPSLLVKLRGEVAIDLRARSTTERGSNRLVATFPSLPDAPVSRFTMRIDGGKKGILVVTRTAQRKLNLCSSAQVASVEIDGQNGRRADYDTRIKTPCATSSRKAAKSRKARKGSGR